MNKNQIPKISSPRKPDGPLSGKILLCFIQAFALFALAGLSCAGEPEPEDETDDPAVWETALKLETGWQRNLFEETRSRDSNDDGFTESSLGFVIPLDGDERMLTGYLKYTNRSYFRQEQINSYSLRPSIEWQVFDHNETNLKMGVFCSRFLERIYDESQNIPNKSQLGSNFGGNWNFESKIASKTDLNWDGDYNYQQFDSVNQDNVSTATALELVQSINDEMNLRFGGKFEFQNYKKRPPETEAPGKPTGLRTVGNYLTSGINYKLPKDWQLEIGESAGIRIDQTTGFYDASVLNSKLELHWDHGPWNWRTEIELENTQYLERPANRGQSNRELQSRVLVFETALEYQMNEHFSVFGQAEMRHRTTNSSNQSPDPVQNNFMSSLFKAGLITQF